MDDRSRTSALERALSYFPFLSKKSTAKLRRLVRKNGESNVVGKGLDETRRYFLADMYTSLVDLRWRYVIGICSTAFILSWLFFGGIWWCICYFHGDFDESARGRSKRPCVVDVTGFVTALLYSIETQHTIGYGGRQLTDACPEAVLLLMTQSIFGMILQALMAGAMFAKLSRAKKRAETIMFSKYAVVCQRDGHLCLMFRIGDMRRSHLVGATIRALLVRHRVSPEGENIPLDAASVRVGFDGRTEELMIMWPVTVVHRIDAGSPLWNFSKQDVLRGGFELIVILEGANQATGMVMQARTSYLADEIIWGHRLAELNSFFKHGSSYVVDYASFNSTTPCEMPSCSASALHGEGVLRFGDTD